MPNLQGWVAIVGGILAILGVVVAVTRYFTQIQGRLDRDSVATENRDLTRRVADLEAQRAQLADQIVLAARAGNAALFQKARIDGELRSMMTKMVATGASIYVPVRSPRGEVQGLVFLSIEPFSAETQALKTKVIPLRSLAGRCFAEGKSFLVNNAGRSPEHFKAAESIADYKPARMLNVNLSQRGESVGVLQILRKEGEEAFTEGDLERAQAMLGEIPIEVGEIARTPEYLKMLGIGGEATPESGTVMFFDLSRSAILFEELSATFALQLLNDYFERICEVGFKAGGTLENYMGDGALLGFNVPRRVQDHQLAAVRAAMEMKQAFADLRASWSLISPRLANLRHRTGISTGPLHRATLGHSQAQRLTLVGFPISVAASLCESANRERDVIVVSAETREALSDKVIAEEISPEQLGKAGAFTKSAFEVVGLR